MTIDALPQPPSTNDPDDFDAQADALLGALPNMVTQINATNAAIVASAAAAAGSASGAATSATAAANSATAASTSAGNASASASAAASSATASGNSASAAAASATAAAGTQVTSTSTSSVAVGIGTKSFVTQAGKQFAVNVPAIAVDTTNAANYVSGPISSYNAVTGALVIGATAFGGSGTPTSWNISISGVQGAIGQTGAPGSLNGGSLTGALNFLRSADVASASTPDIWSPGGNIIGITGTTAITGFTAAPQAGATRTLIAASSFVLTNGANLVVYGGTQTINASDLIDIIADTTTLFRATIRRADGTAVAPGVEPFQYSRLMTVSGPYVAKKTGWHRITLAGSAGQGGRCVGSSAALPVGGATGAGAPGFCRKSLFLVAGQSYNVIIGAGVAAMSVTGPGAYPGVAGSASMFSGTGVPTLTSNGGGAGAASATAAALAGGTGGTATGGDMNVTGGAGGAITASSSQVATGGGALGVSGTTYKAGDATNSGSQRATGGAGIGGSSGNAPVANSASGGGGSGGPGADSTASAGSAGGVNAEGVATTAVSTLVRNLFNATGGASAGGYQTTTGPTGDGAGSGAVVSNASTSHVASKGGIFSGSGGTVNLITAGATAAGPAGGDYGGASGGYLGVWSSGTLNTGGATSNGWALIES